MEPSGQSLSSKKHHYSLWTWVQLCGVLLLASLLRCQQLREVGLSFDESFTMRMVNFPWGEMLNRITEETQPPLFYALLKIWVTLFGNTILAGRVFTSLWGVAAVWAMYLFVREAYWEDQATPERNYSQATHPALLAALLLAITPLQIYWALQIRMYSMPLALSLFSSFFLMRAIRADQKMIDQWLGYCVCACLLSYTHYFGLFVITAQLMFATGNAGLRKDCQLIDGLLPLVVSALVLSLFWQPWLPYFLKQRANVTGHFYLPELDWTIWGRAVDELWISTGPTLSAWRGLVLTQLSVLLIMALLLGKKPADFLIATCCVLPIAVMCLLSVSSQPIITARYLQFSQLFLVAAIAVVCCRLIVPLRQIASIGVAGLLGLLCWQHVQQRNEMAALPGTQAAVSAFDQQCEANDILVVCNPMLFTSAVVYSKQSDQLKTEFSQAGYPFFQGTPVMRDVDYFNIEQLSCSKRNTLWTLDASSRSMGQVTVPPGWVMVQAEQYPEWFSKLTLRKYRRLQSRSPEMTQ